MLATFLREIRMRPLSEPASGWNWRRRMFDRGGNGIYISGGVLAIIIIILLLILIF
jgi:hypothetical protein